MNYDPNDPNRNNVIKYFSLRPSQIVDGRWVASAYIKPSAVDYDIMVKISAQRDRGMVISR